mmetsp:Transcript_12816/g.21699  ORF Transcript_12816/g.21699 Transcript_12816/m.21699 type:complete len:162 (+) Transcript_12816:312-797(+)
MAAIKPELFLKQHGGMHNVMKTLIPTNHILNYSKDDVTSLSLNSNLAKQIILEQELQWNSKPVKRVAPQSHAESSSQAKQSEKGDTNVGRYPPSLLCKLCTSLIDDPYLMDCCQLSTCYKCLKDQLVSQIRRLKPLGQLGRVTCPLCSKAGVSMANAGPNE